MQPPLLQRSGLKWDKRQGHLVCCRDLGWNGSNNKHSLEERRVHLVTITPSILAPVQLARPGWLPRQAKPPLLRGGHGTWNKSHWPWNVKSTMRKARSSPTQTWIPLGELDGTYNFAASRFCAAQSLFRKILQCSSLLSQSCNSCAAAFCRDPGSNGTNDKDTLSAVEIWAEMGQITSTAWKNDVCTLLLLHLQYWHLCS